MSSMHLHGAKADGFQRKQNSVSSWTTRPRAVSSRLAQAGASRDGGRNLPRWATQLESSLHTMVASGNGPRRSSRNKMVSRRRFCTRDTGKSSGSGPTTTAVHEICLVPTSLMISTMSWSVPTLLLVVLHLIIPQLGGSFATHPRLAQRRSLRNFYQHNYPYAWIGARVAYDV